MSLFLDQGQEFIIFSYGCLDISANLLIGNMILVRNGQQTPVESHDFAVKVHDTQAYKNMEMIRERISLIGDMLLSLQMGFSFVKAAVACSILERFSGLHFKKYP